MDKKTYYVAGSIGTFVGSYIPMLFGDDGLSGWSIIGGAIGGLGAIAILYKFSQ